ncbi:MAG TPA: hypothetical protein VGQ83_18920 [Polyangia bacterium]|jgi:hypothetical protein
MRPVPRALARILSLAAVAAACGPIQGGTQMPNPARTTDRVEARQSYEVGPNKENHRFEAAFEGWTPGAVRFAIRLKHPDACADPASYELTLTDDGGRSAPFVPASQPVRATARGSGGAALQDVTVTGTFALAVGKETRWVELRLRPRDPFCKEVRFRWDLTP